jgi:hypothetical protein
MMAMIPAKTFQYCPRTLCATCPTSPATLPRISKATVVPIMKKHAPSKFERLSDDSRIPAYPTMAPNTGNVQQALATALARPSRNAKGNAKGLVPACSSMALAHTEADMTQSIPTHPF